MRTRDQVVTKHEPLAIARHLALAARRGSVTERHRAVTEGASLGGAVGRKGGLERAPEATTLRLVRARPREASKLRSAVDAPTLAALGSQGFGRALPAALSERSFAMLGDCRAVSTARHWGEYPDLAPTARPRATAQMPRPAPK